MRLFQLFLIPVVATFATEWVCTDDDLAESKDVNAMLLKAPANAVRITCDGKGLTGTIAENSMERFSALSRLILRNNTITGIPNTWGWKKNVEVLALTNNSLTAIPPTWMGSPNSSIFLEQNQITVLPASWVGTPLAFLYLNSNPIGQIPGSWEFVNSLRVYLHDTRINGTMPEVINTRNEKVNTSPRLRKGYGTPLTGDVCYTSHFGENCDRLVLCPFDHGECGEGCHGVAGDGLCTACKDGYLMPKCATTASPTASPTARPTARPTVSPNKDTDKETTLIIIGFSVVIVIMLGAVVTCWVHKKKTDEKLVALGIRKHEDV